MKDNLWKGSNIKGKWLKKGKKELERNQRNIKDIILMKNMKGKF